jgi:acyl carrier protein
MDNTPTWDSVEHMNICLLFERQFGIKMNMDIITSVTSIRALAELIP